MTSQGWTPGEYLGAKDAAHAEFHTAANASHIRVVIKDNNLGLGAKVGSGVGHGECTGLDVFQNLLGRLNGKKESEIEKEQRGRDDLKRAIYAERKWGSIRFVKGGVLVGDKIQDLIDGEKERVKALELRGSATEKDTRSSEDSDSSSDEDEETTPEPVAEGKKSSKRKREELEEEEEEKKSSKKSKDKKDKKSKKRKSEEDEDDREKAETKKSKKSKKDRQSKSTSESETENLDDAVIKARKKEKKQKKRREKEAAAKDADTEETISTSKLSKKKPKKDKHKSSSTSGSSTKESTPAVTESSGRSTPMSGIRSIRARHIAQKRMASMDVASLNQVRFSSLTFFGEYRGESFTNANLANRFS